MSSNLKIASFKTETLAYKIISDVAIDATPIVDVTSGGGKIYSINMDATVGIANDYFLKLWLTTSTVTIGTTPPDVIIKIPEDVVTRVNYPDGLPFSSLSAAITDTALDNSNSITTSGNSASVKLSIVTS